MFGINKRVARGVALLDLAEPGWEHKIDLDRLNMTDAEDCVLGQLAGDFSRGLMLLGIYQTGGERHGFNANYKNLIPSMLFLRKRWVHVVEEKRRLSCMEQQVTAEAENIARAEYIRMMIDERSKV